MQGPLAGSRAHGPANQGEGRADAALTDALCFLKPVGSQMHSILTADDRPVVR